jgi:hypothetical protein
LNDKTVVDARFQHLEHLRVLHVVTYVLQNITVRDDTKRAEDNPDRDVDLDIRNGCLYNIAYLEGIAHHHITLGLDGNTHRPIRTLIVHFHLELTNGFATLFHRAPDFSEEAYR